jgi:hypothetical protein
MSRVSDEMAPDARREPRRIAFAYSQGEQHRRRGHIVETRMGSGLAGGLLCRALARVRSSTRRSPLRASHPAEPLRGHDGFSISLHKERPMKAIVLTLTLALAVAAGIVIAQERRLDLKDGPGRAQVEANCGSCHSLDYVVMNSPFLDRNGWDGSVNKMIKVFGAPINADDAKAIIEYLSANYGK